MSTFDDILATPTTTGSTFDSLFGGAPAPLPELPSVQATAAPAPTTSQPEPRGLFGSIFDILGRGQYTSAKFFDSLVNDSKSTFFSALGDAASEAANPQA